MAQTWQVVSDEWRAAEIDGQWWDALSAALSHQLAGWQPLGLRADIGAAGVVVVQDIDDELQLRVQRQDAAWTSHRWQRLAGSDRPQILNEDMPYHNLGDPQLSRPFGADCHEQVSEALPVSDELETAQLDVSWGGGAPAFDLVGAAEDALVGRIEVAIGALDAAADSETAARTALDILRRFIAAERGAVLLGESRGGAFSVAATRGIPDGAVPGTGADRAGLGRFVAGSGIAVMVNAPGATGGLQPVELVTGEAANAVLCVPIIDLQTHSLRGLLELSRPAVRFQPWQLEAAIMVAAALSEALGRAVAGQGARMSWAG